MLWLQKDNRARNNMASPATVAAAKKRWLVPLGRRTAGWSGLVFPLSPGVSLAVCPAFFLRPALRQGQRSNIQQNPNGSKPLASCLCQSAGKISFRVGRISETFQSLSCPAECFHLRQAQFAWAWVECPFNISTVCSGHLPIGDVASPLSSRESTRSQRGTDGAESISVAPIPQSCSYPVAISLLPFVLAVGRVKTLEQPPVLRPGTKLILPRCTPFTHPLVLRDTKNTEGGMELRRGRDSASRHP